MDVSGIEVIFESNEEEQYRAILEASQLEKHPRLDIKLLERITQVLHSVTRQ